jgi:2-hydroxycyclohexanecarboxyl-CoA dehydrogenase
VSEARGAFVTGGAGGIGRAICEGLAGAGMRVAVADLAAGNPGLVAGQIGGVAVAVDITDPAAVDQAFADAQRQLGHIDVCVNCAGWDELKPFLETDDEFSRKVIDINLMGAVRVARVVLPGMVERGYGRVINISSDAGRVGSTGEAVYSAAKGGLIAFTKTIAREMARHGITVNCVCPGPTETPLLHGMIDTDPNAARLIDSMVRAVPMRRLGRPEDIAPAVVFLASEAAGYITGQTLSVSGGLTMA